MASSPEEVRQAAMIELARRELARRQQFRASNPSEYDPSSLAFQQKYGPTSNPPMQPFPRMDQNASPEEQAQQAADYQAYRNQLPAGRGVTTGLSDLFAGAGQKMTDLLLGLRQMRGTAGFDEAKAKQQIDAPLLATGPGSVGNVIGGAAAALPAAFVPGVNTVVGGTLLGGALGALEPTTQQGQRLGNTAKGAILGGATTYAANKLLGGNAQAKNEPTTDAAKTLEDYGIPLDRSQREPTRFAQKLRGTVSDHPLTANAADEFYTAQKKAYNSAILSRIGEGDAKEATQQVMLRAKQRIGSIFDQVASKGAVYDSTLENEIADIAASAQRTVPESSMAPIKRNIDDILNAASSNGGVIPGDQFIKIRRHLSDLSDSADSGQVAEQLEQALLGSLERTYPQARDTLRAAATQWRNMRIIQTAIGKGAERDISPARLGAAIANKANQAMSVYGQGGDQELVKLAQAGYGIIPEQLPNSGTAGRTLMNAPLRAVASYPAAKAGQNYLFYRPLVPPASVSPMVLAPGLGTINSLAQDRERNILGR